MLSIDALKEFGADTDEALKRCMNNEGFYFRLVNMAAQDPNFAKLETALAAEDWNEAFEAAHALKGVLGNLSLTPMYEAVSKLTEALRPRQACDFREPFEKIQEGLAALKSLIG